MSSRAVVNPLGRRAVDIRKRVIVLLVGVVLVAGGALVKLAWLQLVAPSAYAGYGEDLREAVSVRASLRGDILDRNGNTLATSVYRPSIVVDPSLLDAAGIREVATALSEPLGVPREEIVHHLVRGQARGSRWELMSRWVSPELEAQVRELHLPAVFVVMEPERHYPAGAVAGAVVGRTTTDPDGEGISGLELHLDDRLTGEPGTVAFETSPTGPIAGTERVVAQPVAGANVVSTIDLPLQFHVERALVAQVGRTGAKGGTVVVLDTASGDILAMSTVTRRSDATVAPSAVNAAVVDTFEPASVMKPLTLAAVFDAGRARPDEILYVPHTYQVYDQEFSEDEAHDSHLSPTEIMVVSSNVGTILLAERLGQDDFHAALRSFGFGTAPGLGWPYETAGLVQSLDTWRQEGTTWAAASLGQAIAVSPLQLAGAYNILANDGEHVPVRLVSGVVGDDGVVVADPAAAAHRVVSPEAAGLVTEMMVQVVQRGTGQQAQVPGYKVAAKTGTAKKPQANGTYVDDAGRTHYVATMAGYFPAEDPRFTMVVILDEPSRHGGGEFYASRTAAPLFGELAAWILHHFDVPPPGVLVVGSYDGPAAGRDDVPLVRTEAAIGAGAGCDDTTVHPSGPEPTDPAGAATSGPDRRCDPPAPPDAPGARPPETTGD